MRIVAFDIESEDLKADKGSLLCVGYQVLGQEYTYCPSILEHGSFTQKDGWDDRALLIHIRDILSKADMWITHYGKGFDEKFLNTRLIIQGLDPLPPIPHVDTYLNILKNHTMLTSKKLGNAAKEFGLRNQKEGLPWLYWLRARRGYEPAIRAMADYCKQDVRTTVELYEKTRALTSGHPNLGLGEEKPVCPICIADALEKRGTSKKQTGIDQRYHCTACGAWSRAPIQKKGEGAIR